MQWDKSKNYMLIFFLSVNILLAVLIRYEAGGHNLTRERENAIQTVFAQNNINMYYPIPRQFNPMRALRVAGYDYNIERLLYIFFPPYAEISYREGDQWYEYYWGNMRLTISGGYVFFVSGFGISGVPNQDAAIALTQAFVDEHYPDFKLDIQSTRQARRGGLRIFYRQEYQRHIIHTNVLEFLITGEGDDLVIEEVDIHYARPLGFAYLPRDLKGPDEALLTFVQYIRRRSYEPVLITHMDIVYSQAVAGSTYVEPFYRIFIEGQDDPFLINAYNIQMLL